MVKIRSGLFMSWTLGKCSNGENLYPRETQM